MPSRKVSAHRPVDVNKQRRAIRKKKKEARDWILSQRGDSSKRLKPKRWAKFRIPFEKLTFIYNLRPDVFLKFKEEYLSGRRDDTSDAIVSRPKHKTHIRQGILALALTTGNELSLVDFITAKKFATARNTGRSATIDPREHAKWPARPDIFLQCPEDYPDALSEDEIADYYAHEKYKSDCESDGCDSETESCDSEDYCAHSSSAANEFTEGNINQRINTSVDASSVAVLRDLCVSYGRWRSCKSDMNKYGICKTTLYRLREAVKKLHDGEIQGVTWEEFQESILKCLCP